MESYIPVPIPQSLHEKLHLEPSSHTPFKEYGHSLQSIQSHYHAAVLMRIPHLQTEPFKISTTIALWDKFRAYIDHMLWCPSPDVTRFIIVFLSKGLSPPFSQSSAMKIISIVSERENVMSGPSIDKTKRQNSHGTIVGFRTKDILGLDTCHALVQTLRIPL